MLHENHIKSSRSSGGRPAGPGVEPTFPGRKGPGEAATRWIARLRAGRWAWLPVVGAVAILACTTVLGACGGNEPGPGGSGGTDHPRGKDEVVLRVFTAGGFVPVSYNLTAVPEFTLYGDGTVVVTGPVMAIYPGPALPNLQTATISEEAVQAILSAAREAGLFANGVDYGLPGITDVGTTTITINAEGINYRSDIYALGMESGAGGLAMEQQQARAAITDLLGKLTDLTAFATGEIAWKPYEHTALAVYSLPLDPATEPDDPEVQPNRLAWPLGDLSTLGEAVQPEGYRRLVVTGDELVTLDSSLKEATQITLWASGDREYHLYFRPLLPDETI